MAETILKKFVLLGCQSPDTNIYKAEKHYDDLVKIRIELDCLDNIFSDLSSGQLPDVLTNIANHPLTESVPMALTLAIGIKSENAIVKNIVLNSFSKTCVDPKTVLHFVKCLKHVQNILNASKNIKSGIWGSSVRRALTVWYSSYDANALANLLVKGNTVGGWTHKDILKLIHFKSPSPEINSVIQYFGFGKAEAKNALSDDLKILANKFEEIGSCQDELRAARIFEELKLDQYHVSHALYHSPRFWGEYIKSWDVLKVLQSLELFQKSKSLSASLQPVITSIIKDDSGSNIDPSEVYVHLRRYEVGLKHIYKELASEKKTAAAVAMPPAKRDSKGKSKSSGIKPCPIVIGATYALLTRSLACLPKGSKQWVLSLHATSLTTELCAYHRTISVAGAAALTAHYCQQITSKFTFLVPPHGSIKIQADVQKTTEQLQKLCIGSKKIYNDFDETLKTIKSQNHDSAIIMCDRKFASSNDMNKLIENAEKESNIRFAFVLFRSNKKIKISNTNVLLVHGFDAKVLRIISAFLHHEI